MSNKLPSNSEATCGWFNPKTGESGSFASKEQEQEYDNLSWYKKLFTAKPAPKITQSNPYLPPEFYKQVEYTQNYIESGLFARARQFSANGAINIYIEKNKYENSLNRYFYEKDGIRTYLDSKAIQSGIIAEAQA